MHYKWATGSLTVFFSNLLSTCRSFKEVSFILITALFDTLITELIETNCENTIMQKKKRGYDAHPPTNQTIFSSSDEQSCDYTFLFTEWLPDAISALTGLPPAPGRHCYLSVSLVQFILIWIFNRNFSKIKRFIFIVPSRDGVTAHDNQDWNMVNFCLNKGNMFKGLMHSLISVVHHFLFCF